MYLCCYLSCSMVTEPRVDEATTNAAIRAIDEESPAVASEAIKKLSAPIDTVVAGSEESLLVTAKMVIETVPLAVSPTQIYEARPSKAEVLVIDVPFSQADEAGPTRSVASLVTKTVSESMQVSSGEPQI